MKLRLWIVNGLDTLQRYLIKDQFSNLSRTQLIEHHVKLRNRYEKLDKDLNDKIKALDNIYDELERFVRKLICTIDDFEWIRRGALFKRIGNYSYSYEDGDYYEPFYEIVVTCNLLLDDMEQAIRALPEEHPLRQKYILDASEFVDNCNSPLDDMQQAFMDLPEDHPLRQEFKVDAPEL